MPSDIILYRANKGGDNTLRLGSIDDREMVVPLCTWSTQHHAVLSSPSAASSTEDIELVWDESDDAAEEVPLADVSVVHVLDYGIVDVGARQVGGGQGVGNPHGEHSE